MSQNLLLNYATALSQLEGLEFQRAIAQRLMVALSDFQTIPSYPQGDGGIDGHSHKGRRVYFCYGMENQQGKTAKQCATAIASKFSNDLQRVFELQSKKRCLSHKDNLALMRIFGSTPDPSQRIENVTLITNWFRSHEALGTISKNRSLYSANSQCRWIKPDPEIVLRGPSEFADQFGADESSMAWLMFSKLGPGLKQEAATIGLADGPTFDSKMLKAEQLVAEPDRASVKALSKLLRDDWQLSVVFEQRLSDRLPALFEALEDGRGQLLRRVLMNPNNSWDNIRQAQQLAEEIFGDSFEPAFGKSKVRDIAMGEVARLIGSCPLDWTAPQL